MVKMLLAATMAYAAMSVCWCLANKGTCLVYPVEGSGWLYRESVRLGILWKNPRLNYMIKELKNECSRSTEKDS